MRFNDDSTSNSCNYIHWDSGLSDGEGGSTQGSGNHQNGADNIKIGVGGGEGRYVVATGFILNYYDGTNKSDKLIIMKRNRYDEDASDGIDSNTWLFGKVGVKDAVQLPTLDAPDTMLGGFTRGIGTFLTGWFTGGRIAKGVGALLPAKAAIKATQAIQANPIKTSFTQKTSSSLRMSNSLILILTTLESET